MNEKEYAFDAVVIGFGKGGKTIAGKLGANGKKVALVEKSNKMYGGTCINVGCIPSKSLYTSAKKSSVCADDFSCKKEAYSNAVAEQQRLTGMLRKKNYEKLANNPNITVIDGNASFVTAHKIKVSTADGEMIITAPNVFINTGSVSVVPLIEGILNNSKVFYSDTLMNCSELPENLTVIGGGYIGLEFASMYANFGSKVTVLQDGEIFLPREDDDISESIKQILENQNIKIITSASIKKIKADGTVVYEIKGIANELASDAVLVATGRRPNTDGLNASEVGINLSPRGAVVTDDFLRTTADRVWAMGDVTGRLQFTYTSLDDYRIVYPQTENVFDETDGYSISKRKNVPYNVFIGTPFARVGINEKEAAEKGIKYRVVKMPAAAIPKAQVLRNPQGMLKALISENGNILGAMPLCEEAYEIINIVKLAMDLNAPYTVLRDQVFTHPTMSEALNDLFAIK